MTAEGLRIGSAFAPVATPPAQQAEEQHALSQVALFAGLDEASLHTLQELCFRRTFEPGETIVEEGRTGNGAYVVLSGKVEVIRGLPERPQVVATMGPGEPFGELALLGDWKRTASVQAVEQTTCIGIDRWVFLAYLRREPQLAAKVIQVVTRRLVETDPELAIEVLQQVAQRLVEADRRIYG
jgi:CRP-like cAMP-binding protein